MESSRFDASSSDDFVQTPLHIVYNLEPGVRKSPRTFWPEHILDVIISRGGERKHKDALPAVVSGDLRAFERFPLSMGEFCGQNL